METKQAVLNTRTMNRAAIKQHALKCSQEIRAGKFERVSENFLDMVQADLDALVRQVDNFSPIPEGFRVINPENESFVSGYLMEKLQSAVNAAVARIIQRRVHRHPTVGKTLMG